MASDKRARASEVAAPLLGGASQATSPAAAASTAEAPTGEAGFSMGVAVAFTVNYIVGCGFLGIPAAFVTSGLVLGPIVVVVFGLLMELSKDFMLEALGRAEALKRLPGRVARLLSDKSPDASETAAAAVLRPEDEDFLVDPRHTFEVTDLFFVYFGRHARTAYMAVLSLYLYGGLWAYSIVFASSFAANVPVFFLNGGRTCNVEEDGHECLGPFFVWLAVFALLAVPLSCLELKEQVVVQVAMFGARVLVVLLMCLTVLSGYSCGGGGTVFADMGTGASAGAGTALAISAGLSHVMPVAIYAFIFHHSIPVLSQPVADKRSLSRVFAVSFVIVGAIYVGLGLVLSAFFGHYVDAQCNLNWRQYVGCVAPHADGSAVTLSDRSGAAQAASFVILIFPALDVLSAFPLNAVTLGNNLMSACYGLAHAPGTEPEAEVGTQTDAEADKAAAAALPPKAWAWRRVAFRLIAAVPPVFAGALSTYFGINLGQILQFTGLIGVAIAFGFPALLRLWSFARHSGALVALSATLAAGVHDPAEAPALVAAALREPLAPGVWRSAHGARPAAWTPYTSSLLQRLGRVDVGMLVFAGAIGVYIAVGMAVNGSD